MIIGTLHTHNLNSFLPSGNDYSRDDQAVLTYSQGLREAQRPGSGSQARIYIAAHTAGSYETLGPPKIAVYDVRNRDAAIAGVEGPEVNPEAQPCP